MLPKRIFISTGDPSGDIHAARVAASLRKLAPGIQLAGIGGKNLQKQGVALLSDQSQMARIGFGAILSAPYHYLLGQDVLRFLDQFQPDGVLLIDYGGFHLWLAGELKKRGHRVFYYIPPQVWASRRGRLKKIQANVDHVFCIFPFEKELYEREGIPVTYVGHPLVSQLPPPVSRQAFCQQLGLDPGKPIVAMLPGSRRMELNYLLKPMMATLPKLQAEARKNPKIGELQFVLAQADAFPEDYFKTMLDQACTLAEGVSFKVVRGGTHALLSVADAGIIASGTATLEAALYDTPMVIVYRGPWPIYQIAKRVCQLPCIGLPNILTDMENPIAPELWQNAVNPKDITSQLIPLLTTDSKPFQRAKAGFADIAQALRGNTVASTKVAEGLIRLLYY